MARTYGTLALERAPEGKGKGARWRAVAEPDVISRFGRVFASAEVRARTAKLAHSPEAARDLLWFLGRYPLEVAAADMAELRRESAAHVERLSVYEALLAGAREPREFPLALPPRGYQRRTADAALTLGGLLCADDPGLGKTVTGIAVLSDPAARPALVVTLANLTRQWAGEIQRFLPGACVHVLAKATPYDMTRGGKRPAPDVVVANYHKIAGWEAVLAGWARGVVFDEVGELRHAGSAKYQAAKEIAAQARVRLGLSATPVFGYGGEIFNVLDVLRPGALGTRDEFDRGYCAKGHAGATPRVRDPAALGSYLREQGLVLRHTRSEVGRELPPLTRSVVPVDSDLPALEKVQSRATELALILLSQVGADPVRRLSAAREISALLRLATGLAKARYVADFVRLLAESGERVLLFGHHHGVYDLWGEHLSDTSRGEDLKPAFYTGRESASQKEAAMARFLSGESRVLVMANRSGLGVDGLQRVCRTIVVGELDWAPAVHEQNIGRAFRDGQPDPVHAWFPVSDEGSDPVIAEVLGLKRAQSEPLRDPDAPLSEELSADSRYVMELARAHLKKCSAAAEGAGAAGAGGGS